MDDKTILSFSVVKNDDKLSVSMIPQLVKGTSTVALVPLVATGTPEELDNEYVASISQPIQKVSGMVVNTASFETSASKKVSVPVKSSGVAPAKPKSLTERLQELAAKFDKDKKYKEAADVLDQAYANDNQNKKLFFDAQKARQKVPAPGLFEAEPENVTIPDYVAMVGGKDAEISNEVTDNDEPEKMDAEQNPEFIDDDENENETNENEEE